ncbi:MAG: hypothetical protein Q7K41_03835 [Dehalococcoidales bacterium]|nr:hypothetical protein [Dehalococcoidales bacterium]
MTELTKLQESILILASITSQIEWAISSFKKKEQLIDDDLKRTVCNHIQILLCSYLEEWKRLEHLANDEEVRKTLYCVEPAISRLKRWTGLHRVRSQFLAHPQRDKRGKFVSNFEIYSRNNVPTAYAETIALGTYAIQASYVLLNKRHRKDYELIKHLLKPEEFPSRGFRTLGEVEAESQRVAEEITERLREIT